MPRRKIPTHSHLPYHITARCINKEWFELPLPLVWSIMGDYLYLLSHHFNIRIHQFTLMGNHFHLVVSAPDGNLSEAMRYFMRETSLEITRLSGRINQTYGGRFHRSLISTEHHLMNVYKYVYRNPVRAGICKYVEEYPYSTLSGLLGQNHLIIPIKEDQFLFKPEMDQSTLDWLNKPSKPEHDEEIRKALRRSEFKLPKAKNRSPSELEVLLI